MHRQLHAIEDIIQKMVDPVSEYDRSAVPDPKRKINQHMTLSEHEIIDASRMLSKILTTEPYKRLTPLAGESWGIVGEVARMRRPA